MARVWGDGYEKHGRAPLENKGAAAPQAHRTAAFNRKPEEQWGSSHRTFGGMGGTAPLGQGGDQRGCAGRPLSEGDRAGPRGK